MKLIRSFDLSPSDLPYVEDPFFAESEVRGIINNSLTSHRLLNDNHGSIRISENGWGHHRYTRDDLLKDVENGHVLLLKGSLGNMPFKPLVRYDESEGRWRPTSESIFDPSIAYRLGQLNRSGLTPGDLAVASAGGVAMGVSSQTPQPEPPQPPSPAPLRSLTPSIEPVSHDQSSTVAESLSEPGFHVVQRPTSLDDLKAELYGDLASTPTRFEQLNPELLPHLLPGQMIVLGDPNGFECTEEEARLMDVASQVNRDTRQLTEDEAQFLVENYDLLQFMVSSGAAGLGAGSFVISQQINSIKSALEELEDLHQRTYNRYGNLSQESFFQERRSIFQKLDFALGSIARRGMSLDPDVKLKRALGLSSKSIVHHWNASGVGDIPGYSTHYDRVATAAKWTRTAGYVGLGLDITATSMIIQETCTTGRESECAQVTFVEVGRLGGSIAGGSAGGLAGTTACVAIGFGSGGIGGLGCFLILGGAGSVAGSNVGGEVVKSAGEKLYEVLYE